MKRRSFLSLIGGAALAPAMPSFGAVAPAAASYNRYMYGLAVFHARTRASVTAADLIARLGVSAPQASAMMSEMTARGVLSSATGAVAARTPAMSRKPYIRKALRQLEEFIETVWDNRDEGPNQTDLGTPGTPSVPGV